MARRFAFISPLMVPIMLLELTAAATLESADVAATTADGEPNLQGIWTNAYDIHSR